MQQPEVQKDPAKQSRKNIIVISLIIFSLIMLAAGAQLIYMVLKYDRVYKGVYINNLDVSGLTQEELQQKLKTNFQDKINSLNISLETEKVKENIGYGDINVSYETDNAAKAAFDAGRTGNMFERLYDIANAGLKGLNVDMSIAYDQSKLNSLIDDFYKKTFMGVKEADILIQENGAAIRSGHHGENIDKNKVLSTVDTMIKEGRGGQVKAEVSMTQPAKLDVEDLYARLNKKPENASFKVVDGKAVVVPHTTGMKIGKDALAALASELDKTEDTEKIVPVELTQPEITTEHANAMLFKDQLAYSKTWFSTSNTNDSNRAVNIRLAAEKINGRILAPGEEFSFNDIVGPRTEETGYKIAHTYVAGKVVDDIGGGICQVSTTLYGAVLKSDLEVVERRNHMFTVGYVPYGQDATVSYGTTDFRFKNSTKWPIKIEAGVNKNTLYFALVGTNETPGKQVIITQQILKKIPFATKYIDDPTLTEGKTSVKQEGKEGYVVDTFKTIKMDGKVSSQVKLHTSSYKPLDKEILRGTKKPASAGAAPTATPVPVQTVSGVDDADNPPAE